MSAASTVTSEALRASEPSLRVAKKIQKHDSAQDVPRNFLAYTLLAAAALCCLLQLFWFYRACIHNIDFDGLDYVGIARQIVAGHFRDSINAFRSPLLSWLIALLRPHPEHFVLAGKLITFASYLATSALLYLFTLRLWNSPASAATAILWYTLGRGIFVNSLLLVSPDYLFTALTLIYFLVLENSLRAPRARSWFYLGCVQGLAYLVKAFALPWFALTTALAIGLSTAQPKQKFRSLGFAAIVPVLVAGLWGSALCVKYGVFTTGSQFKTNLLQWTLRHDLSPHEKGYELVTDTSQATDAYMVTDPMPPGSPAWTFHPRLQDLLPGILRAELRNLPRALKEIALVVTPGGCLLFCFTLFASDSARTSRRRLLILSLIAFSSLTLVLVYCMMVFDERYVLPLVPLLIAVAAGQVFHQHSTISRPLRLFSVILVLAGLAFTLLYPASPFRTLTRDFEASCVDAGSKLQTHPGARIVTLGEGPFPEHGVGWEAGYKSAFFGGARVVAAAARVRAGAVEAVERDIIKSGADAVLLWGNDAPYKEALNALTARHSFARTEPIVDPQRGQVGTILFMK